MRKAPEGAGSADRAVSTASVEHVGGDTSLGRAARTLQLTILRPNGPVPADVPLALDWPLLAATTEDGMVVGAVTVCPESWPRRDFTDVPMPSWRLRSLAVAPDWRRRGIGRSLIIAACAAAHDAGAASVWAEARESALALYAALGWVTVGLGWLKPGVGLHAHVWIRSDGFGDSRLPT